MNDNDELKRKLESAFAMAKASASAPIEGAMIAMRQLYDALTDDGKKTLKAWIGQLAPLYRCPPGYLSGVASVTLKQQIGPEEYLKASGVPIPAMMNATPAQRSGGTDSCNTVRDANTMITYPSAANG